MGFYGSKLLGQNTTFKFDRIYPNRKTMEENRHTDGVYIGRYVLIDYGLDDDLKNPTGEVLSRHFYLNPNSDSIEIYTYPDFEAINDETGEKIYRLKYAESEDVFYDTISMQDANNNFTQKYYQKDEESGKYIEVFPPFFGTGNVFVLKEPVDTYILKETIIYVYEVEKYNLISSDKITDGEKVYFWKSKDESDTLGYQIYTGHIPYQDENGNILETGYNNVDFYEGVNPKKVFYYCDGKDDSGYGYATFKELSNSGLSNYSINYNIDLAAYTNNNGGRGYDSTVWQKVFKDGEEYYINIADLNTVIPTFDITVDGPTLEPRPPHFDANSTNVYYNLHTQPSWGFRVKEAERKPLENSYSRINDETVYPSDLEVDVTDTNYWDSSNGNREDDKDYPYPKYAGAIYFNKAGFNSKIRSDAVTNEKDNGIDNSIEVTPTGQSGQKYNTHDGTPYDKEIRPDIQELSIMLPGIGNTISELWDLAYGDAEANKNYDINNEGKRNRAISWDDETGLRLVNRQTGENETGFTYSEEQIDTIAGCINSVHDLMGMIIDGELLKEVTETTKDTVQLENAQSDKIYYNKKDGRYWIKDEFYEYSTKYEVKDENDNAIKYSGNEDLIEAVKEYPYQSVEVYDLNGSINYYVTQGNDYLYKTKAVPDTSYYTINAIKEDLNVYDWVSGKYYYKDGTKYIKANENYDSTKKYYDIDENDLIIWGIKDNTPIYPVELIGTEWYVNNKSNKNINWYYIDDSKSNENTTYYTRVDAGYQIDSTKKYFEIETSEPGDNYINNQPVGNQIIGEPTEIELYSIKNEVENVNYYYKNDLENDNIEYILIEDPSEIGTSSDNGLIINGKTIIKVSTSLAPETKFYESNKYWYQNENLDWIQDISETKSKSYDKYYTVSPAKVETYLYQQNKFYYVNSEGDYCLDTNEHMTEYEDAEKTIKRVYYLKQTLHVMNDNDLLLPKYTIWNPNADDAEVLNKVTLARKVIENGPSYRWVELEGFARTLNTIHGLIIRINHMLEFNDLETRENTSVMGCINQMHDIINSFADLVPEQFAVIDNYGRVQSADFDTSQSITASKNKVDDNDLKDIAGDKFNEKASSKDDMRKQWITVNIDGNVDEPKITVRHNYQAIEDTNSSLTLDTIEIDENNIITNYNDIINLQTPLIDDMGHVVGENIEAITLPSGYKTINGHVARHTKDSLTITGDLWINVPSTTDPDDIEFQITHKYPHEKDEEGKVFQLTQESINLDNLKQDSFKLGIPVFDETGHIMSYGEKEIILPNSFKTVNGITANSTQGILNINGNEWITLSENTDTDTLTINHKSYELISGNGIAPQLSPNVGLLIPYTTADSAGHVSEIQNGEILFTGDSYININNVGGALNFSHTTPEEIDVSAINGASPEIVEESTLSIPLVNVDEYGHVTGTSSRNVQLPSATATTNSFQNITVVSSGEDPVSLSPESSVDSLNILGGKGITLTAEEARNNFPAKITISSTGLALDSELDLDTENQETYYPEMEIQDYDDGITLATIPWPAYIEPTDTLEKTLVRMAQWIENLNRRILELEGFSFSSNNNGAEPNLS